MGVTRRHRHLQQLKLAEKEGAGEHKAAGSMFLQWDARMTGGKGRQPCSIISGMLVMQRHPCFGSGRLGVQRRSLTAGRRPSELNVRNVATLALAFRTLENRDEIFFCSPGRAAKRQLSELNAQNAGALPASQHSTGIATVKHEDENLFAAWALVAWRRLGAFHSHNVATGKGICDARARAAMWQLSKLNAQNVASAAWPHGHSHQQSIGMRTYSELWLWRQSGG